MSDFLVDALHVAFDSHGIAVERGDGTVRAADGLTVEPRVFPRETIRGTHQVQVDFEVLSPRLGNVPFLDSFGGLGPSQDEAVKNAFLKFLQGSFHVIAESCTTHDCDARQVEWEEWRGAGRAWRVCIGPLLLQSSDGSGRIEDFSPFFQQITREFTAAMPSGPHWMRLFLAMLDGRRMGSEVLVDGAIWPAGHALLDAHPWRCPPGYASFRNLIIALPA